MTSYLKLNLILKAGVNYIKRKSDFILNAIKDKTKRKARK